MAENVGDFTPGLNALFSRFKVDGAVVVHGFQVAKFFKAVEAAPNALLGALFEQNVVTVFNHQHVGGLNRLNLLRLFAWVGRGVAFGVAFTGALDRALWAVGFAARAEGGA